MANREKVNRRTNEWRKVHHTLVNQYVQKYRRNLKVEVMQHYSGKQVPECANPYGQHKEPYTDLRALTIDHVFGGGHKHLKQIGFGQGKFYAWLKRKHYPPEFQVLCFNCNLIKRFAKGHAGSVDTAKG